MNIKWGLLLFVLLFVVPDNVTAQIRTTGIKFGFYDMERPALGIAREFGGLTPRLRFNADFDLVFTDANWFFADASLKYFPRTGTAARPYFGGGLGVSLGDESGVPAHFVFGLNFRLDRLPTFAELKIHLDKPSAFSLWLGIRY